MPTQPDSSIRRSLLALALAVFVAGGCQAASPTPEPTPAPTLQPTPAAIDGGTVTLTDTECTWEGNPGSVSGAQVTIELQNDTDDFGVFFVHRLKPEFSWQDGVDAIAAIQAAMAADEDWPNWASNLTTIVSERQAEAGGTGEVVVGPTPGTIGIVCSANTDARGTVLTVFLAGPLEVAG
ncbi:MAG: hypothetical protein L0227_00125 [Chloroflexi bacterium]|nr:hypothetical protein [Chloroflexota bacterium]